MQTNPSKKAVLVISSHVVRGSVGNRAAVFALEVLGHPVWAVPTIILPWHPGHGPATRIIASEADFSSMLRDVGNAPWLSEVGAILTGYMAAPYQIEAVAKLIRTIRAQSPGLVYLCDPVIGDRGGLYIPQETADLMRDELLPLADISTPNRFELEYLSGKPNLETAAACADAAKKLPTSETLITSAPAFMKDHIANLLVGEGSAILAEHRIINDPPNGLGDLTAATFLANRLSGLARETCLARTTGSVFEILADTAKRGSNELTLEQNAGSLHRPVAMVQVRSMGVAGASGADGLLPKKTQARLKPSSL